MSRLASTLLLVLVASGIAGCGHQPYRATAPDLRTHCVDGLQALSSHPLTYLGAKEEAEDRRVEFAAVAACVTLAGGPQPVALYRLDELEGKSQIDIRVLLSEGGTFAAAAELLDADFQPVKQHPFSDFVRRTNEYSLSIFLDRTHPAAPRYLLLRPDTEQVGKQDSAIGSQSTALVMPGGGAFRFGTEVTRMRPLLDAGQLQVVAYPARLASVEGGGKSRE